MHLNRGVKHPDFKHPYFFACSVALGVSFAVALSVVLGWLPRMENANGNGMVWYCPVLSLLVLCCVVLYCVVLYCAVFQCIVLC